MKMYGSLTNRMSESMVGRPEPEIGMGATLSMWSDRHPYTIVAIVRFKTGQRAGQVKEIHAQRDHSKRLDSNYMSESQKYEFSPNPDATVEVFRVKKDGSVAGGGGKLLVGHRSRYHDYSF